MIVAPVTRRRPSQFCEFHPLDPARILALHEESEAALAALALAEPGDVVVLTPTRVEAVWRIVQEFRPGAPRPAGAAGDELVLEPPHG